MPVLFDGLTRCEADGRSVLHLQSDDVPSDTAELEYLYPLYEIVPGERSIFVLVSEKQPQETRLNGLSDTRNPTRGR